MFISRLCSRDMECWPLLLPGQELRFSDVNLSLSLSLSIFSSLPLSLSLLGRECVSHSSTVPVAVPKSGKQPEQVIQSASARLQGGAVLPTTKGES